MIATFLLLGNSEAETRSWATTQVVTMATTMDNYSNMFGIKVLIGKTGKEALKRRVKICDVANIPLKVAHRVRQLLEKHDIDSVREASQGCATFYAWVSSKWSCYIKLLYLLASVLLLHCFHIMVFK